MSLPNINLKLKKSLFNDVYFPCLNDYNHRYEIYYGGAGSGKSHFIFQKVIIKALKSKRKVLVIRKVMATHKDSCWQMAIDTLCKYKLYDLCEVNKSTYTITLPNESVLLFKGLDNPEKIKSITGITDIICEECTELTLNDVSQLDLRLRTKTDSLQMYFMFNPTSKANWVYTRWFSKDVVIDNDTFILKTTYKDNKFLPEQYVLSLEKLRESNPTYYRIYALGEFASLDKLVYNNWTIVDFNEQEIFAQGKLLVGLDYGFITDPTAIVASILIEDKKEIYIFNEFGKTGMTNPEIANIINAMGFSKSVIVADSAEQKSIEEIKRSGITRIKPSVKGADSVIHGIQKLQQYKIYVSPKCEGVITELQNYCWTKDKQSDEYINKPIDKFNHFMDALRYSLQCIDNNSRLSTIRL